MVMLHITCANALMDAAHAHALSEEIGRAFRQQDLPRALVREQRKLQRAVHPSHLQQSHRMNVHQRTWFSIAIQSWTERP